MIVIFFNPRVQRVIRIDNRLSILVFGKIRLMAGDDFYTNRAFLKMKQYGLSKADIEIALSSSEFRDSNIPGTEHKVTYLKTKGLMVGVIYKFEPGGRRVIISCWGRKQ